MTRRIVIVQARTGSTRLPGKVLKDLAGSPMLAQQLRRLRRCRSVDDIVLATSTRPSDDDVASLARVEGVHCYRGSEDDVLSRYVGAAVEARADVVVRVTADCPLIDPAVTDRVIDELTARRSDADYASNALHRTFPKGLDCEAFFVDALLRADRLARTPSAREHVTLTFYADRRESFLLHSVTDDEDNSDLRWTVDYPEDLALVRLVFESLDLEHSPAGYREIAGWMRSRADVMQVHAAAVERAARP